MTDDERKLRNREKMARYRARHRERVLAQGRAQSKKWHAAHRAESMAASKAYHETHRDEQLSKRNFKWSNRSETKRAHDTAYRIAVKDRDNARRRDRRAANPEQHRRKQREWRAANVEAARLKEAEYRAKPEQRAKAVARTAQWMRTHPEHARMLGRKQDAKRRAIEQNAFVEVVDHRVVFARDHGICGICKEPVDPMSRWEIDHIVPIMRGGLHSYANVQLAHRKCNRSKGAKLCA
jgi:5-methylcytosine-specific restriction endonuclease McrA